MHFNDSSYYEPNKDLLGYSDDFLGDRTNLLKAACELKVSGSNKDYALELLEEAAMEEYFSEYLLLERIDAFDAIRNDPKFIEIKEKMRQNYLMLLRY